MGVVAVNLLTNFDATPESENIKQNQKQNHIGLAICAAVPHAHPKGADPLQESTRVYEQHRYKTPAHTTMLRLIVA